jgi:hypothetical protein
MSTKTQKAGAYKFLMRTYVYKLETLEDVKPSITKSNSAQASDVEWILNPGKYLLVTVAPSRYGYGVSVFKVEVGANVAIKKVGIIFIKSLDEVKDKITELVAGKTADKPKAGKPEGTEGTKTKPRETKKAGTEKPKHRTEDEVEDVDVDEGGDDEQG